MILPAAQCPRAAYLHIPFCRRRCFYCDFPVSVVGDRQRGETSVAIAHYVEVLCQEIQQTVPSGQALETIFFGGGTPSLLAVAQLEQLLRVLEQTIGIAANAEISMEMDPGTFDWGQLAGYQQAGVNRVSLGVQAFQPHLLQGMGRTHTVDDIDQAITLIRGLGIPNFSLDLIAGLPNQTLEQWQDSLGAALALAPNHLSAYDLMLEPGTAFSRQYQPGTHPLPTETTTAEMYRLAQQVLTGAGYEHYEISNYARPGYHCRHNRVYWENRPFYGFGMGAASYLSGQRFTRPRTTKTYCQWVEAGAATPEIRSLTLTVDNGPDRLLETLMLGFRLAEGLSLSALDTQFGDATLRQVWQCLQPFYHQGWVEVTDAKGEVCHHLQVLPAQGHLRLSDPEGFLFSNTVLAALFATWEATD
ncbi:coproporphyrinogen III oxidase [Neosynechococcus sphagnicola sy1]|uniref:Heme chaperone HemW n=1 Tax=Neosynechococcus sphagnicola sy1 TaxID=1497020 RepID=A0A098TM98_9CYAN|nr:coproporphyrinogen III oxidase [Neosynechococcus sphagnicola sy1]